MNKNKKFTAWRVVGIVVTALLIIAGFAGAYWMGVQRGALTDGDSAFLSPMGRYYDEDGVQDGYYSMPHMGGYYSRSYYTPFSFVGRIFGFLFFVIIIGAFLRLIFFPFRWRRFHRWGMAHHGRHCHPGHHPYGPWGFPGDEDWSEGEMPQEESPNNSTEE